MSSTEYKIFVMQASVTGQEIETVGIIFNDDWWTTSVPDWNWKTSTYRIKLPEGWEYVIEDDEIAFRVPKRNEYFLGNECTCCQYVNVGWTIGKRPIIKRKDGINLDGSITHKGEVVDHVRVNQ